MSFPSSRGTRSNTLALALQRLSEISGSIKVRAQDVNSRSLAGAVTATFVIDYLASLASSRSQMQTLSAAPGLAAYAQAQYNDGVFNIVTEFASLTTVIDSTIAWVLANFPKDGSGNLSEKKFDALGNVVLNTFSTVSLTGLRAQLDLLIAAID